MPIRPKNTLEAFYQGRILNIAHRGARAAAPENTLPAFLRAAEIGADGVELDVQLTADGVPVVFHDTNLDRTTDGTGRLADHTLAQLRELDAGSHFGADWADVRIPTLAEVFDALGDRMLVNVELKAHADGPTAEVAPLADAVITAIREADASGRVILSSFNPIALRAVKRRAPDLPLGYLYAPDLPLPLAKGWLARPIIGRHAARHPHYSMVDHAYMRWARRRGYRVNVWTVNDVDEMRRLRDLGVDALISDYPDLVQDVLQGER